MKKRLFGTIPMCEVWSLMVPGFLIGYSLAFAWLLTTKKRAFPLVVDQDNRFGYNRLDSL
jgi:hypothetical protein